MWYAGPGERPDYITPTAARLVRRGSPRNTTPPARRSRSRPLLVHQAARRGPGALATCSTSTRGPGPAAGQRRLHGHANPRGGVELTRPSRGWPPTHSWSSHRRRRRRSALYWLRRRADGTPWHRRHVRPRRGLGHRAPLARSAPGPRRGRPRTRRRSPSPERDQSTWAVRRCWRCASRFAGELGWELYATGVAAGPLRPRGAAGPSTDCDTPATTRWTACAPRRASSIGVRTWSDRHPGRERPRRYRGDGQAGRVGRPRGAGGGWSARPARLVPILLADPGRLLYHGETGAAGRPHRRSR